MEFMVFNNDVYELFILVVLIIDFNKVGIFLIVNGMYGLLLILFSLVDFDWLIVLN